MGKSTNKNPLGSSRDKNIAKKQAAAAERAAREAEEEERKEAASWEQGARPNRQRDAEILRDQKLKLKAENAALLAAEEVKLSVNTCEYHLLSTATMYNSTLAIFSSPIDVKAPNSDDFFAHLKLSQIAAASIPRPKTPSGGGKKKKKGKDDLDLLNAALAQAPKTKAQRGDSVCCFVFHGAIACLHC